MERHKNIWRNGKPVKVLLTVEENAIEDAKDVVAQADAFVRKTATIKSEAGRRILVIASESKQRNMLSRRVELLVLGEANWSTEETDEVIMLDEVWFTIRDIRTASHTIEASLASMTQADLASFDVTTAVEWP